jgi:GrpB-like predicted nucleotidyltransferase (UPF0157 family)
MSKPVVVEVYNPQWPLQFQELHSLLWPAVKDVALSIEHVGSTSVPGLAAKPVLDIDIVISDMSKLERVIMGLAGLGYEHRGNLGIEDREAFRHPQPRYKHNLYVCPQTSIALINHLSLRDTLRADAGLRDEYAKLKFELAQKFPNSIDDYLEGKTAFILRILEKNGLTPERLEEIRLANLAPAKKS